MKALLVDLRYAWRSRIRKPRVLLLEVGTLTLGLSLIGLTISIAQALVGGPALRDADRVVGIAPAGESRLVEFEELSYPAYRAYAARTDLFQRTAAVGRVPTVIATANGRGGLVVGESVTAAYFDFFDLEPAQGRLLSSAAEIVLSDNAWRRLFGADRSVVGARVQLGGAPYTVVGVAPASFTGLFRGVIPDFWVPLDAYAASSPRYRREIESPRNATVWVFARLKDGVGVGQAQAAVGNASLVVGSELPLHPAMSSQLVSGIAAVLFGQVILLALITAANFATLTSMRTMAKYGEMIVRLSLGATSRRILRLLLAENLMAAAVSTTVALAIAWGACTLLSSVRVPLPVQVGLRLDVDALAVALTFTLAFAIAILVSVACTLGVWSTALASGLRESATEAGSAGAGRKQARVRHALVVAEVALSLILIGLAGLAIRGLSLAKAMDIGFDPNGIVVASITPGVAGYDRVKGAALIEQVVAETRTLPGVEVVSTAQPLPLSLNARFTRFRPANTPKVPRDELPVVASAVLGPDYFRALKIPVLAGREFRAADDASQPRVALINRSMASLFFKGQNPLGQTIAVGFPEPTPATIVGIVRDSKMHTLSDVGKPAVFTAARQDPTAGIGASLLVRATGDPVQLEARVLGIVKRVAPDVPVFGVQTLRDQIGVVFTLPRFALSFFGVSAAIAILFASLGLYAVIALSMTLRTREIGIRIAVGASERSIFGMAMRSAVTFGILGVVPGAFALVVVGPVMVAVLYGVRTMDLLTVAASIVVTMTLCILAACGPARRASRVNPLATLRYQ
jgi:putative ABC transport system permease protein